MAELQLLPLAAKTDEEESRFIRDYISEQALEAFDALGYATCGSNHAVPSRALADFLTLEHKDNPEVKPVAITSEWVSPVDYNERYLSVDGVWEVLRNNYGVTKEQMFNTFSTPGLPNDKELYSLAQYLSEADVLSRAYRMVRGGPKRSSK